MSYKNLNIWKEASDLVVDIHKMTLENLPRFEMYEEGAQTRRSIKSVKSNIAEGYGRRMYKQEFIRFIIYALSSTDETLDHLETLYQTGSLDDNLLYNDLHKRLNILSKMINRFLHSVQTEHNSPK